MTIFKQNRLTKFWHSFLFLLLMLNVNAQNPTIIQAGIVSSKLSPFLIYSSRYEGLQFRLGLNVGFYKTYRFPFNSDFRLRYGALYQRLGEKYKNTIHVPAFNGQWDPDSPPISIPEHDVDIDIDVYLDEIKCPLLVEYHIDDFFVTAGLNMGYVLGGKAGNYTLKTNSNFHSAPPEKTEFIKKMDYSASFGFGYKLRNVGFHLIYNQGLRYMDFDELHATPFESYSQSPFEYRYPVKFKGNDGRLKPRSLVLSLDLYFNNLK